MNRHTNPQDGGFPADLLVDLRVAGPRAIRATLEHALRTKIQSGLLMPGTLLPPSRVLAGELGVSRSVVVAAYANLAADGYLDTRRGAATRVSIDARPSGILEPEPAIVPGRDAVPLAHAQAPARLLGGIPDPALFPRQRWLRHYRAALTDLPDAELTYPHPRGNPRLRHALSAYLGRVRGVAIDPDRVLVCAGVTQGIALLCRALRHRGARRVAVEDPCFAPHRETIALTGLDPVPVPVDGDGLDIARLAREDVDAVLVAPAHSYPTGSTLPPRRRHALIAWAREGGKLIIEDDYDAELRYDRAPIGALQGTAPEHVAYLGTVSKTLTPALRLGWIVATPDLIDSVQRQKRHDDMGSSLLEQVTLARLLDHGDFARHLRRVRPIYRERRDGAIAAVGELLPGASSQGAAAGLHLQLTLDDGVDVDALVRTAYDRGILIANAARHWADPTHAPPALVLGYAALPPAALRRAMAALASVLIACSPPRAAPRALRDSEPPPQDWNSWER